MTTIPDRDLRQRDIIPPDRLAACKATVIGVGAIGRQVALELAAMGIPSMTLIDFDTVEPVNLACQGYFEDDLGRPKVQATADLVQQLNHQIEVVTLNERFRRSTQIGNILFCCVDKIETRQLIWDAIRDRVAFFADGRMSAETIRILVAADPASRKHYPTTLFAAGEAHVGACTAKSTIFCANIAAGLMLEQFARHLRGMPVDADLQFNLLSSEILVAIPGSPIPST
jgi:molybdopterin-synthase adenylyltransferase